MKEKEEEKVRKQTYDKLYVQRRSNWILIPSMSKFDRLPLITQEKCCTAENSIFKL